MIRPLVFALALTLCATGVWADEVDDCNQSVDLDRKIRGCTQVIERGKRESHENRSFAYTNRGTAYRMKGEYDRAIADYDKAIKLDPNIAAAYRNRGLVVYNGKGEVDQAIADFRKVLEINPSDQVAKYFLTVLKAEKTAEEAGAAAKPKEQSCINPVRTAYGVRCR